MSNLYSNLSEKKFKILTIICCIFADICVAAYIWVKFSNEKIFKESVEMSMKLAQEMNPQLRGLELADVYQQLWQLFITTLIGVILVVLVIHLIVYILHYLDKGFAYSYIKLYAWSGGIMMTLFAIINSLMPPSGLFLAPGLALLFVALGMKEFPFKSKEE